MYINHFNQAGLHRIVAVSTAFHRYAISVLIVILIVLGSLQLVGCERDSSTVSGNKPVLTSGYIENGDLADIQRHRKLRVLVTGLSADVAYLPRSGLPINFEVELLKKMAAQLGLEPVWVRAEKFENLMPMLLEGRGDVIAANLTVTEERKKTLAFSVPVTTVTEQLVVRQDDRITSEQDLKNRRIAIQPSASYWNTVQVLKRKFPDISVEPVAEHYSVEQIIEGVANKEFDVTVVDSNLINAMLPFQTKVKVAFDVSDTRAIAWAVRPNAVKLLSTINRFLTNEHLTNRKQQIYKADLADIKQRKVLRVLTRNNAATYFLWRGELMGFEYELAREFAKSLGVRLEMIIVPTRSELMQWLKDGKGDMIAASMTIPQEAAPSGVRYSRSYHNVSEMVVTRIDDKSIETVDDLAGRNIYVRSSSSYWKTLSNSLNNGGAFTLTAVPETLETENIIAKVASGDYDLTVSDRHILDIELAWRDDIKAAIQIGPSVSHGWVMREDSPALLKAVNQFIKKEYKGLFYNIIRKKYFQQPRTIKKRLEQRVDHLTNGQLSPYDELIKTRSTEYDFDWRMVVAQMFQESRFDPQAKSWAGALGLMQIMPRTAKELGIEHLDDPAQSIHAGIKYLAWLRDRFEPELAVNERMWFVLAAYNAGVGHVRDARRLAKQKGWESDRWFDHVEQAMLLLSQRKYAKSARHGYVRGIEPVKYVRDISNRYNAYLKLTQVK
ncbi:MAG: transporter substrate-binding domain-containing protein [Gammaproteobacteria bacterium]|nr:transporter substrate-binding domain-containing protein [Gammaproteobacteria bacterium]